MQDGKGYYYTYDVTRQIDAQTGHVTLNIVITDGPDLPKADPSETGSGVTARLRAGKVSPWT